MRAILGLLFPVLLLVAGCGSPGQSDDAGNSETITNRPESDPPEPSQAEPTIISSSAPQWRPGEEWTLSDTPVLEIGLADGPDPYVFGSIGDAVRLSDGRIAIVERFTSELRFFSSGGDYLFTAGRKGEGPGEYLTLEGVHRVEGDSLFLFGAASRRVTVLKADGEIVRTFNLESSPDVPVAWPVAASPNGTILAFKSRGGLPDLGGRSQDTLELFTFSRDGDFVSDLSPLPGQERFNNPDIGAEPVPFSVWPPTEVGNGVVFLGTGLGPRIEVWEPPGRQAGFIQWEMPTVPVTNDLKKLWRKDYLAEWGYSPGDPQYPTFARFAEEVPFPGALPFYDGLVIDELDNLWVHRFSLPWESSNEWLVFNPERRWLGMVDVPAGFEVRHIAADLILGVSKGPDGVERVLAYPLNRGCG